MAGKKILLPTFVAVTLCTGILVFNSFEWNPSKKNDTSFETIESSQTHNNTINRKAPDSIEELKVSDVTRITNCWTEPETELQNQSQIEKIKTIVANLKINNDTNIPTNNGEYYEGGTWIRFYNGENKLFELHIVGPDDIGECMITSDNYCFFCDIDESSIRVIRDAW